jgi:hypothetical protein
MSSSAKCPNCLSQFEFGENESAEKIRCPECSHLFPPPKLPSRRQGGVERPSIDNSPAPTPAPPPKPMPAPERAPATKPHAPAMAPKMGTPASKPPAPAPAARMGTPTAAPARAATHAATPGALPLPLGDAEDPSSIERSVIGQMEPLPPDSAFSKNSSTRKARERSTRSTIKPRPRTTLPAWAPKFLQTQSPLTLGIAAAVALVVVGAGAYFAFRGPEKKNSSQSQSFEPIVESKTLGIYGGVEIGSSGVKMVVVEMWNQGGVTGFNVLENNDKDTEIVKVARGAKDFDPEKLKKTTKAIKEYFDKLHDDRHIPLDNIFIVSSSGVLSPFDKDVEAFQRNRARLAQEVKEKTGKELAFIDAAEEARYSTTSIVAKVDREKSLLLDIGSGNSKGGGFDKRENFLDIELELGSKTYEGRILEKKFTNESFVQAARRLTPEEIVAPLRRKVAEEPLLTPRPKVHLIGGIVWAMATFTHPEWQLERRLTLTAQDIDAFQQMVETNDAEANRNDVLRRARMKGPDALVAAVEEDLNRIQKNVFKDQNRLVAGSHILKCISEAYDLKNKEISFFRLGHYSWMLGYVLKKSGHWK